jgi:hypothetical protein
MKRTIQKTTGGGQFILTHINSLRDGLTYLACEIIESFAEGKQPEVILADTKAFLKKMEDTTNIVVREEKEAWFK